MIDLDGLRTELNRLAGEARPADLTGRVAATSRRVRRRRRATGAAIGGAAAVLALILGVAAVTLPGERDDSVTRDNWPAGPFPRVWRSGDRELMDVTLPDGSVARLSYPKSLSFKDYDLEVATSYVNRSPDLRGRGATCCTLYFEPALRGRKVDTVTDRRGEAVELWQGRIVKGPASQPDFPDNPAYLRYGRWVVELSLKPEETLDAAAAERIVRRLDLRRSGGYLEFPAEIGAASDSGGLIQPDPADVIRNPVLRFRRGHGGFDAAGSAEQPARALTIQADPEPGHTRWQGEAGRFYGIGFARAGLGVDLQGLKGTDHERWARRLIKEIKIWRLR